MRMILVFVACLFLLCPISGYSLSDMTLNQLVGYVEIGSVYATNSLQGNVQGQLIALDNGMIFKFTDDDYLQEETPEVSVFQRDNDYKIVINDQIFNVTRVQ